ncbi:MAG TPA: hypothetical protein VMZ52_14270 [Bryobacteraceae bacterium]|nr:hypothetical protein [Bryobacteraceae bacterium]
MKPPLSYSLPAYQPDGYGNVHRHLDNLKELGFTWVTFTPTWLVYDEIPMRIDPARGPAFASIRDAVGYASSLGMRVKMEPHLDWETTLTGGPYEWRRRMYFPPDGRYADEILAPLLEIPLQALTLGSELDVSLVEFSNSWRTALSRVPGALSAGHKINHDSLGTAGVIRDVLNAERRKYRVPEASPSYYAGKVAGMGGYLQSLAYVSFSFYPDMRSGKDDKWWRQPTGATHVELLASAFRNKAMQLASDLRRRAGADAKFAIGEFGLGCADPSRPYDFTAQTFLNPDGSMNEGAREMRRKYYLSFLECLRRSPELFETHPVSFWTVTHFDFLGALEQPGSEIFRDEALRAAVAEYNAG